MERIGEGKLLIGTLSKVNGKTFTGTICSENPLGHIKYGAALPGKYDPSGSANKIDLPNEGVPVVYTVINGDPYVLGTYFPINYSPGSDLNGDTISRKPSGMNTDNILPGDCVAINASGGKEIFNDMGKEIVLSPNKLSSAWNLTKCMWENICNIFKLSAAGFTVEAGAGESGDCTTLIMFGKSPGDKEAVVISAGAGPSNLEISVGGSQILHIDNNKNVTIHAKDLSAEFKDVQINCENLTLCASSSVTIRTPKMETFSPTINTLTTTATTVATNAVDMTACNSVKLP